MQCVPYRDLSGLDGVYNCASHNPHNGISPDLGECALPLGLCCHSTVSVGPKMYIAYATTPDNQHRGSTRLHMDITDAVNINMWSAKSQANQPGYALWHLFLASDAPILRKFLVEECSFTGHGDPIHSQIIYFTPDLLRRLFEKYGIRPYTIRQYPGEAVFIPAYCAHQVANMADAIKIACDFFSMPNLKRTQRIVGELRHQRLSDNAGDDVLQFYLTLWYTWVSLGLLSKTCPSSVVLQDPSHELDILADMSIYPNCASSVSVLADVPSPISVDSLTLHSDAAGCSWGDDATTNLMDTQLSTTRAERKRQRAKERKKIRREEYKVGARGRKADQAWKCPAPTCKRMLNRNGLFDHM
jgi:hypothetical protein